MGCGPLSGRKISSTDSYKSDIRNPNPLLFNILRGVIVGDENYLIVAEIQYIGCTNFEGRKILVFQGITEDEFKLLSSIDPHFYEDTKLLARFPPTKTGWDYAILFAQAINQDQHR